MRGLAAGQSAAFSRIFGRADLEAYAGLAGLSDAVPLDAYVPGPLLGGMFSYLLGTRLPGRGTNYLKQRLSFPRPARLGDELTATVEVTRLRPEKDLVNLRTVCVDSAGRVVCEGEALVLVKDVEA
jgi:3-hydroxybutyryl-CoA dehydratase